MLKEEKCPYCSASLEYDENNFSGEVECKYCHTKIMVIREGEYVRTKDGYIGKCQKNDVYYGDILIRTELKRISYDFEVIKHSFNIAEILEEGDYVNGMRVSYVRFPNDPYESTEIYVLDKLINFIFASDIKSVVTSEQFKAMEYEVK